MFHKDPFWDPSYLYKNGIPDLIQVNACMFLMTSKLVIESFFDNLRLQKDLDYLMQCSTYQSIAVNVVRKKKIWESGVLAVINHPFNASQVLGDLFFLSKMYIRPHLELYGVCILPKI